MICSVTLRRGAGGGHERRRSKTNKAFKAAPVKGPIYFKVDLDGCPHTLLWVQRYDFKIILKMESRIQFFCHKVKIHRSHRCSEEHYCLKAWCWRFVLDSAPGMKPAHPEAVLCCHMAVWEVTCVCCGHSGKYVALENLLSTSPPST